ncbi:hypothetical protein [Leucobacter sp. GX24907]
MARYQRAHLNLGVGEPDDEMRGSGSQPAARPLQRLEEPLNDDDKVAFGLSIPSRQY